MHSNFAHLIRRATGSNNLLMETTSVCSCRSKTARDTLVVRFQPFSHMHLQSLLTYMNMEGENNPRLPLNHPHRIKARDLKLQRRDEERARRTDTSRYRCPCNLCGGRRRPYKSTTVARHLRHRGRHGALRGWTQVRDNSTPWLRIGFEEEHLHCLWSSKYFFVHPSYKSNMFGDTG